MITSAVFKVLALTLAHHLTSILSEGHAAECPLSQFLQPFSCRITIIEIIEGNRAFYCRCWLISSWLLLVVITEFKWWPRFHLSLCCVICFCLHALSESSGKYCNCTQAGLLLDLQTQWKVIMWLVLRDKRYQCSKTNADHTEWRVLTALFGNDSIIQ